MALLSLISVTTTERSFSNTRSRCSAVVTPPKPPPTIYDLFDRYRNVLGVFHDDEGRMTSIGGTPANSILDG